MVWDMVLLDFSWRRVDFDVFFLGFLGSTGWCHSARLMLHGICETLNELGRFLAQWHRQRIELKVSNQL